MVTLISVYNVDASRKGAKLAKQKNQVAPCMLWLLPVRRTAIFMLYKGGAVLQGYFLYLSISLLAPGRFDKWVSKEDAETPKSEMDKALRTKEEYEREKKQRNDS